MGVVILEKADNLVRLKMEGESHTLLNLLTDILLSDERVDIACYDFKFPTVSDPILTIRTYEDDPIEVLKDAAKKASLLCDEFIDKFSSKLK
jgi:DNA-directed RNA polymerase subunit L